MSPTSYQTALPRSTGNYYSTLIFFVKTIVKNVKFQSNLGWFSSLKKVKCFDSKKTLTLQDGKKYN